MSLTGIHGYVLGFALMGLWAVVCLWALGLRVAKREESPLFWRVVSIAQILLGLQLLAGIVLLVIGRRPGPDGDGATLAFHLAYGLLFPVIVLLAGHKVARDGKYRPHSVFAVVGLVVFGLTARAWMVGTMGA
jgi:hypothetical protein